MRGPTDARCISQTPGTHCWSILLKLIAGSALLGVHCRDFIVGSALRERIVGVKRWSEAASPLIRSLVIVDYLNRPSSPSPFGFLSVFYLTVTF